MKWNFLDKKIKYNLVNFVIYDLERKYKNVWIAFLLC